MKIQKQIVLRGMAAAVIAESDASFDTLRPGEPIEDHPFYRWCMELKLPQWMAVIGFRFFQATPEARCWVEEIASIAPGMSRGELNAIRDRFQVFWLERQLSQIEHESFPAVVFALECVLGLLRRALADDEPAELEWSTAHLSATLAAIALQEGSIIDGSGCAAESAAWSAAAVACRDPHWSPGDAVSHSATVSKERNRTARQICEGLRYFDAIAVTEAANRAEREAARMEAMIKGGWLREAFGAFGRSMSGIVRQDQRICLGALMILNFYEKAAQEIIQSCQMHQLLDGHGISA